MNSVTDDKANVISLAITEMERILTSYERGSSTKKQASNEAKTVLSNLKKHVPNQNNQEAYDFLIDLCISLTTIHRAEPKFESFYLQSLKEELEKAKSM